MVSYAAGSRYLSLLGGVCMSFYDWYCDLPPASPMTWGEQTDVPESADWYNSGYLLLWGSNVPQTRTPDAHFYTEARYRGTKSAVICPDYSEAAKFGDVWLNVKQGTDAALAMAFGHVILREFHLDRQTEYFDDYTRKYSDFPMLVKLDAKDGRLVPGRFLRAGDLKDSLGETNNPEWKTVALDSNSLAIWSHRMARSGIAGARKGNGTSRRGPPRPRPSCRCRWFSIPTAMMSSASISPISAALPLRPLPPATPARTC